MRTRKSPASPTARWASASVLLISATLASCGSNSKTSPNFATQLNDVCRTLDGAVSGLPSATPAEVAASAESAASALSAAVTSAAKLSAPKEVATQAKTFVANLGDEAKLLGEISAAAKSGDQATLGAKTTALNKLIGETTKVADEIGATRCSLDPLFVAAAPVDTIPVVTVPPITVPVITVPPITVPAVTIPPVTIPPVTIPQVTIPNVTIPSVTIPNVTIPNGPNNAAGSRRFEDIAASLTVRGAYELRPLADELMNIFLNSLGSTPAMNAASVQYGGIEIVDSTNGGPFGRVFGVAYDQPVAAGTLEAWTTAVAKPSPTRDSVIDGKTGKQFTDSSGAEYFVVGDDTSGFFIFVASNGLTLGSAVTNFFKSF